MTGLVCLLTLAGAWWVARQRVQHGALVAEAPLEEDGCRAEALACGQRVRGSTVGAFRSGFDGEAYEDWFCWPNTSTRAGGERWYRLALPPGVAATVTMEPNAVNLDLAAIRVEACPAANEPPPRHPRRHRALCDMLGRASGESEELDLPSSSQEKTWWLVVEGPDDQEGEFEISVACQ